MSLGARNPKFVHALVLLAFVGPAPTTRHVGAHGDGIRHNNVLGNLRWATPQENEADKRRHGTAPLGMKHGRSKLSDDHVLLIRCIDDTQAAIAHMFGVARSLVGKIRRGENWSHL